MYLTKFWQMSQYFHTLEDILNDSSEVFRTCGICLHFRLLIGIYTGASGGVFANIACVHGIDFC